MIRTSQVKLMSDELTEVARIYQEASGARSLIVPQGDDAVRCIQAWERFGKTDFALAIYGYVWQRREQKLQLSGLRSVCPPVKQNGRTLSNKLDESKFQEFIDIGNESTKPDIKKLVKDRPKRFGGETQHIHTVPFNAFYKKAFQRAFDSIDDLYGDTKIAAAKKKADSAMKKRIHEFEEQDRKDREKAKREACTPEQAKEILASFKF